MFGRIARRYDLMNTLITLGQDARWRASVARTLDGLGASREVGACSSGGPPHVGAPPPGGLPAAARVLDIGSGTGRLARAIQERHRGWRVVGVDFTLPMLAAAPRGLSVVAADAQMLPFSDRQFDGVVSGFLVRNLADLERGVAEQVRVLRPGGILAILETTPGPTFWPIAAVYRLYFRLLVPVLGKFIAGDAAAYTYLPESTLRFLEPSRLAELLRRHDVLDVHVRILSLGTVAITTGRKRGYASAPGERT